MARHTLVPSSWAERARALGKRKGSTDDLRALPQSQSQSLAQTPHSTFAHPAEELEAHRSGYRHPHHARSRSPQVARSSPAYDDFAPLHNTHTHDSSYSTHHAHAADRPAPSSPAPRHRSGSDASLLHPYAPGPHPSNMPRPATHAVVADSPEDDEPDCPVCLEPLSFSFRLPGEKPHVLPACGHALHEQCFREVYGPVPLPGRPIKTSLGVCGVCRQPMKLSDGDVLGGPRARRGNKLATLTGLGLSSSVSAPSLRAHASSPVPPPTSPDPSASLSAAAAAAASDPNADDPIPGLAGSSSSVRSGGSSSTHAGDIATPSITVRSEFASIVRPSHDSKGKKSVAAIVTVEMPPRRPRLTTSASLSTLTSPPSASGSASRPRAPSDASNFYASPHQHPPLTPPGPPALQQSMAQVASDLFSRVGDWKNNSPNTFGSLLVYAPALTVRREAQARELRVYLFTEALLCVGEERKPSAPGAMRALKLKGRIFIANMRRIAPVGDTALLIETDADDFRDFTLSFSSSSAREPWRATLSALVSGLPVPHPLSTSFSSAGDSPTLETGAPPITRYGSDASSYLSPTTTSSRTSGGLGGPAGGAGLYYSSTVSSRTSASTAPSSFRSSDFAHDARTIKTIKGPWSAGPPTPISDGVLVPHTPVDLILILSLPPASSSPAFKLRLLRSSLEFVLAHLGPRDRMSVVTFSPGLGGQVRKTPFLAVGTKTGRRRMEKMVESLGVPWEETRFSQDGAPDPYEVQVRLDEKTDVITAVNAALDTLLQRKTKNPLTGALLVSDTADSTRRAQMDLVLARAEAANVPIHSFGYSRVHDPSSLWLISSATAGTYTFVKEFYHLRDCLAGAVGGLLSIALSNVKLHLSVLDLPRFRMRKVSPSTAAIVSADGRDVHIDLGELRFGERCELLVELEMAGAGAGRAGSEASDGIEEGLAGMAIHDPVSRLVDAYEEMIDEAVLFEVDASFHDPAAAKSVTRLLHPILLTLTIHPPPNPHTSGASPSQGAPDPSVIRRRMELLASDMTTRALLLVSRRNHIQAQRLLAETQRCIRMAIANLASGGGGAGSGGGRTATRRELANQATLEALEAVLQDLDVFLEALEEHRDSFDREYRNFGAQQAMILRDQKSWTGRTPVERLFWRADNSIALATRSAEWVQT